MPQGARNSGNRLLWLAMTLAGLCTSTTPVRAATTLTFTPTSLTFPVTTTGKTSTALSTTVKNTGSTAASISSVAVGGNDIGDFSISSNTCPASLAAAATCTVSAVFKPGREPNPAG